MRLNTLVGQDATMANLLAAFPTGNLDEQGYDESVKAYNSVRAEAIRLLQKAPAAIVATDPDQPGDDYVLTWEKVDGPWKTDSDYTTRLYYKDGENYYPVTATTGNIAKSAGSEWTAETARTVYLAHGNQLYYLDNGDKRDVYMSKTTWYSYDGNSHKIYENFTKNLSFWGGTVGGISAKESDNNRAFYVYTPSNHMFHAVYGNNYSELGDYAVSLWYYTNSTTGSSVDSSSTYDTARSNGTITLLGSHRQYSYAWLGEGLTSWGDGYYYGDLYLSEGTSNYYNKLYYQNASGNEVVLAYPEPGTRYSETYSGDLWYDISGATALSYEKDGSQVSFGTTGSKAGDTLYTGELYIKKWVLPTDLPDEAAHEGEIRTDKTLDRDADDGTYDITMKTWATGNSTTTTTAAGAPMDIVLVVDQSGSMGTADMGNKYAEVAKTAWTVADATGAKTYFVKEGEDYHPVYGEKGPVYEKVSGSVVVSDMFGEGHDAITLGVNGAPTYYNVPTEYGILGDDNEVHKLFLITAGLFGSYGLYPYAYVDNNDLYTNASQWTDNHYWVAVFSPWGANKLRGNSQWKTLTNNGVTSGARVKFVNTKGQMTGATDADGNSAKLSYSWISSSARMSNVYKLSDDQAYNSIYYYNNAGQKVTLGSSTLAGNVVYNGTLYEGIGTTRVEALQDAVRDFVSTVQANGAANSVQHRIAIVGFAGNKVPGSSDGKTAYNTTKYDYTNSGLFVNNTFVNYETMSNFREYTGTLYINRHYFIKSGSDYVAINYNVSKNAWYRVDTGATVSSGPYYVPDYTALSDADYASAMMNVDAAAIASNGQIGKAIDNFANYGGTYTSYGMTMANKILANAPATEDGATRQKVVIVFTDGEPGGNGYESSIAGEALVDGDRIKDSGVKIFTVGLFKGTVSQQTETFMKELSSEYAIETKDVYGGTENYGLGSDLKGDLSQTYYYINEADNKPYAITAERGGVSSLGWWKYNATEGTYTLVTPRTSTGAGSQVFYTAAGVQVTADKVQKGTTYYDGSGSSRNAIVYEYRWYDSDRNIVSPKTSADDTNPNHVQFFELSKATSTGSSTSYYMTAADADGLNRAFATISTTFSKPGTAVDAYNRNNTFVVDEITAEFDLPEDPNAAVKLYSVAGTQETNDSDIVFSTDLIPLTERDGVTFSWEGKKLKVEGWDFNHMYIAPGHPGEQLVVKVEGLKANTVGENIYSNTPQSGVYHTDDSEGGTGLTTLVVPFPRPSVDVEGYSITWMNLGETLEVDSDLLYTTQPSYEGAAPVRTSVDPDISYTFVGWAASPTADPTTAKPDSQLAPVNKDSTFYAIFTENHLQRYTVTWKNYDGTDLEIDENVAEGTTPEYNSGIPTRPSDATNTYMFAGWSENENADGSKLPGEDGSELIAQFPPVSANVTYYAIFVAVGIQSETMILDYSAKMQIANDVNDYMVIYAPGGDFALDRAQKDTDEDGNPIYDESGVFSFTPKLQISDGYQTYKGMGTHEFTNFNATGFAAVNTATYTVGTATKKINVVPANNVYFDEDLYDVNPKNTADSTLKAALADTDDGKAPGVMDTGKTQPISITFKGDRIDVFCTLDSDAGSVTANLYNEKGELVKSQAVNNRLTGEAKGKTYYNAPTVTMSMDYGTYTLSLLPSGTTHYKIDGVRIYNAAKNDTSVTGTYAETERNAEFKSVRSYLLDANSFGSFLADENATELVDGALYIVTSGGAATPDEYKKDGPKNEVYLDAGQGVAFTVTPGKTYQISVGAMLDTAGKVTVSNGSGRTPYDVLSTTHMYYTVVPDVEGNVFIKNSGDAMISIADLKITDGASQAIPGRIAAGRSLLAYVQSFDTLEEVAPPAETEVPDVQNEPDTPDAPEDPTPDKSSWNDGAFDPISLLKNLFKQLLDSLNNLFNGLVKW